MMIARSKRVSSPWFKLNGATSLTISMFPSAMVQHWLLSDAKYTKMYDWGESDNLPRDRGE